MHTYFLIAHLLQFIYNSCMFLFHSDVQFLSTVATFQPSSRTVAVTLTAVPDDIQEPLEIVTLDFEITATIDVAKGSNSQATVNVSDNTPREFV